MPRLIRPNMKEIVAAQRTISLGGANRRSHEHLHQPRILIYTSTLTLNTTAGPKLRLPVGGEVTRVSARVQGAPSGAAMQIDYLIDGITAFDSGTYLRIPDGQLVALGKTLNRNLFSVDSAHQVQIFAISGATGPLVFTIEFLEAL